MPSASFHKYAYIIVISMVALKTLTSFSTSGKVDGSILLMSFFIPAIIFPVNSFSLATSLIYLMVNAHVSLPV